jgi:hypothetical protein
MSSQVTPVWSDTVPSGAVWVVLAILVVRGLRHGKRPLIWGLVGGYNLVLVGVYVGSFLVPEGYPALYSGVLLMLITLPWSIVLDRLAEQAVHGIPLVPGLMSVLNPGLVIIVGIYGGINSAILYGFSRWLYRRELASDSTASDDRRI